MAQKKQRYETNSFGLKNNYQIKITANKDLMERMAKGIEWINNNGYKDITQSAYIREAIRKYTMLVLNGEIETGLSKLHKRNVKRGIII